MKIKFAKVNKNSDAKIPSKRFEDAGFDIYASFSEENIIEKIEYYRKKNLDFIIIENTKYLMQSMKKTKARYNYLTEEKMFSLDESNYSRLFMSEKRFQKTYGVSTDALIRMYGLNPQIID